MNNNEYFLFDIRRVPAGHNSKTAYDSLYATQDLEQIESFYLWLISVMRFSRGSTLLDISCGAGALVRLAASAGIRTVGVDISEVVARVARKYSPASIVVGAGENLPLTDASFDYVTNIGSLEHFVDPLAGVREMRRVLKPGGKAFILVPNTFSLLSNVWIAFRQGHTAVDDQPIQRYGARTDWERLIQSGGLVVEKIIKYERAWPRLYSDWLYYLKNRKDLVRLLASPLVPLNLAFCFLFVCRCPGS